MLRRTVISRIHLFSALVPNATLSGPKFLSDTEVQNAKSALEERKDVLGNIDLLTPISSLTDTSSVHTQHVTMKAFNQCVDELRAALYNKACVDPLVRLQLHEAIMAAGYYQRTVSPTELQGEGTRFALNHFNFDVRRDTAITKSVHDYLLEDRESTKESEKLLQDLLLLERELSGKYRFMLTGGRRWFVLGMPLSDIKTEAELQRLLELPVIKEYGNFEMKEADTEKLWKTVTVVPKSETTVSFIESAKINESLRATDLQFDLRVQKPEKPKDFWERFTETLLRYWVIWFALWATFFMVDEEVLTLVALIFLKHRQTKIMEAEAEKQGGGKVYIARATGYHGS